MGDVNQEHGIKTLANRFQIIKSFLAKSIMTKDCAIHFVFLGILNQTFMLTTVMTPDGSLEAQKWRR